MNSITGVDEESLLSRMTIVDAVRKLTIIEQAVLALRYAGYTQKESSTLIGVTRAAVGYIEKRAIRHLRSKLEA